MGVDSHMFDHLLATLIVIGVAIGIGLCGLAWFLFWLFSHIHWNWA